MKLVLKAILHKKFTSMTSLIILSFMVLLAAQVTISLYSKNTSLVSRIDAIQGAHLHVYQTLNGDSFDLKSIPIEGVTMDSTYAIHYSPGSSSNDIFLEGYVSNNNNFYQVIEGKELRKLDAYEIAITESYARALRNKNIDPIGHIIKYQRGNQDPVDFQVVSIIDYPNFNDMYQGSYELKNIGLFDYPATSVAIGNYQTIQQLADKNKNDESSRLVHKIYIDQYSAKRERAIVKQISDAIDVSKRYRINVAPLYEITRLQAPADILFQFLSPFVLGGLLIGTGYTFYIFLRKQLMQDAKTIGMLVLQGVRRKTIIASYGIEFFIIAGFGLLFFIIMNIFLLKETASNRSLSLFLDSNSVIIVRTLLLFVVYCCGLMILFYMQLKRYMHNALTSAKTSDYSFVKQKPLQKNWLTLQLVLKSMSSTWKHTLGSILSLSVIAFTLLVSLASAYEVSKIYNRDTLGVTFDYLAGATPFEIYHGAKNFSENTVIVVKWSNLYFLDLDFASGKRTYYKSNMLFFMNRMDGFVEPYNGQPIDLEAEQRFLEYRKYLRYTAASRRHMDERGLSIYGTKTKESITKQYLFYQLDNYPGDKETAAPISATVNTLIDNGWIAFDLRFFSEKPDDNIGGIVPMFLMNVKDEAKGKDLEEYLSVNKITYQSYDEVIRILNNMNQENNKKTLYMLFAVSTMMLFVGILNLLTSIQYNFLMHEKNDTFLHRIGIRKSILRRKTVLQEMITIVFALSFAGFAFLLGYPLIHAGLLRVYGLYVMPELPFVYYSWYALALLVGMFGIAMISRLQK